MSLKKKATSGIFWTFFEMFGGQLINFFVNIILARKLFPEDYGLLGMIFIFITISNTLMDSGLTPSVMRTKRPLDQDYSTLFTSNICFSIILYAVLFFTAPLIANFYNEEIISSLIRIYGLTIIIQAFVQVQSVYLIKNLQFRKQTLMKLPSIIISSAIAIYMAYSGFGVWSLIFMTLIQNFLWALFHWIFGSWRPKLQFKADVFKEHFGYGYRMTLVELMNNITANIYQISIGKFYNPSLVGYYTQSLTLRQVPMANIYGAATKVLFPIFAELQDNRKKFVESYYKCQEILMLILFPIFIFLIFNAKEVLVVLFSEKWGKADVYLQILSLAGILNVLSNWNLTILKIISHSKRILRMEFILKLMLLLFVGISLLIGKEINYLLFTIPLLSLISYVLYSLTVSNLLKEKLWTVVNDVLLYIGIALIPAIICYLVTRWVVLDDLVLSLLFNIVFYFSFYVLIIYLFKKNVINFLLKDTF